MRCGNSFRAIKLELRDRQPSVSDHACFLLFFQSFSQHFQAIAQATFKVLHEVSRAVTRLTVSARFKYF